MLWCVHFRRHHATATELAPLTASTYRPLGGRYPTGVLERWTRAIIRWRFAVIACWVVILFLGSLASIKLPELLTTSLTIPGTSSAQANLILIHSFGESVEGTFTVV